MGRELEKNYPRKRDGLRVGVTILVRRCGTIDDGGDALAGQVLAAALTDVGCVRGNNEDCFGGDAERQVFVVCDGMGGVAGGEVASSLSVEAFLRSFAGSVGAGDGDAEVAKDALFHAAVAANQAVRDRSFAELAYRGMGATLVAACVRGDRLMVINLGDSRAYLVRDGDCTQLTSDHTFVAEQVRLGMMTPEVAGQSPLQSVITRAIGIEDEIEPDLFGVDLESDDLVMLMSDGLTRYVSDQEMAEAVSDGGVASAEGLHGRCAKLIEMAKSRGGADNITVILLQYLAQ
jgi:serine/threonine protein phosphatase PrpC